MELEAETELPTRIALTEGINPEKAEFRTERQQEIDVDNISVSCKGNTVVVCCLKIRVRPMLAYVSFK